MADSEYLYINVSENCVLASVNCILWCVCCGEDVKGEKDDEDEMKG